MSPSLRAVIPITTLVRAESQLGPRRSSRWRMVRGRCLPLSAPLYAVGSSVEGSASACLAPRTAVDLLLLHFCCCTF